MASEEEKTAEEVTKTGDDGSGSVNPVKKNKSFKRIRGLLSGKSRRKTKEKEASASAPATSAATATTPETGAGDEQSTIYNVDVEDRSVVTMPPTAKSEEAKKGYMLKVVLLLMDPETRRFELLQLEFDSLKALVSDVLAQIPVSVTEEPLRKQTYTGICGRDGKEMTPEKLLSSFCKGNDVLVAIPTTMPAKECARLARPILSDDKVVSMLLASGVDAKAWREKKKKAAPKPAAAAAPSAPKPVPEEPDESASPDDSSVTAKTFTVLIIILVGILLQVFHLYISAPIKPGHVVSPGIWLTKCGIMSFLPSCENLYVNFSEDGVVKLFDADDALLWEIDGGVCKEGDDDCIPGMQVKEDNTLVIGGKLISSVKMYQDTELSPWPFAEQPKIRMVKVKK